MTRLLTYEEAATLAKVSEQTIRRRVKDGDLKMVKEGVRPRIPEDELYKVFEISSPPRSSKTEGCRIIAVANQKGGVGKTTTTANLAAALAVDSRVLAVDCDPQGNLTQALGLDPDRLKSSLYDVLVNDLPVAKAILNPVLQFPRLSLVGSNLDLAMSDVHLSGAVARELILRQAIAPHLDEYDFIFLDCPPALGLLTINALACATEVIVPVAMGVFALRGVSKLLDIITTVRKINPNLHFTRALCSMNENTVIAREIRGELEETFTALGSNNSVFDTTIRKTTRIQQAQAMRQPLIVYSPKDDASKDYYKLAKEVKGE